MVQVSRDGHANMDDSNGLGHLFCSLTTESLLLCFLLLPLLLPLL